MSIFVIPLSEVMNYGLVTVAQATGHNDNSNKQYPILSMKKPNQLNKKISKTSTREFFARSFKHVRDDFRHHKIRWAMLVLLNCWVVWTVSQATSTFTIGLLAALQILLFVVTLRYLALAAFRPGRVVHDWALEEQKHERIKLLTGATAEELEIMLQYHMEQGNIVEADKISQRLLASVDGANHFVEEDGSVVQASQPAATQQKSNAGTEHGLPGWLSDEQTEEADAKATANLPDWMKS